MTTKRDREAEETQRRKMVRQRFRNLLRSVVFNRKWLIDTGLKPSLNVKKNIPILERMQRKIAMLTLAEKALIRTHHNIRSIDDRKRLVTLMAGLVCFSEIPPKLRARLVKAFQFLYLGSGRTIIKQGDKPLSVYFILTGEVEISKKVFDHLKNAYFDKTVFISGPGDCLGDIEMIEEIPRRTTCITASDVELLVVNEDDFNEILRPVMEKQWLDKKAALKALDYFNYLHSDQIVSACKLGVMRQFEPLETIYYEDKGHVSYVHFVISGECMILQCLKMKVTQRKGKKTFELVDTSKNDVDTMFQNITNTEIMMKLKETDSEQSKSSFDIGAKEGTKPKLAMRKMDLKSIEILCGIRKGTYETQISEEETRQPEFKVIFENLENSENVNTEYAHLEETNTNHESHGTTKSSKMSADEKQQRHSSKESNRVDSNSSKRNLMESKPESLPMNSNGEHSQNAHKSKEFSNTKIENYFIDVGSLSFGSIFGLGEKLEHRVIMARTTVQCLMLPRFWLFEKEQNPGNIWQRRRFYLDSTIPSREALFTDFLATRKWQKFKKDLIERSLDPNSLANPTKIQDIPIICRLVEANDE